LFLFYCHLNQTPFSLNTYMLHPTLTPNKKLSDNFYFIGL